ncbi:MAG: flippase-like domain-containing protein [Dysgonamonadaceae bacterium]|jgi:uncharacterized protein (TIRG00374 family)|nr:flippase-like domain-containing protein [Dysgonamonadaceae bacterium]
MPPKLKALILQTLKVTIPLFLGIIILYFLYKGTNFSELWATIRSANWVILSVSLLFGLSGNVIRGLRWNLIIKSLGYYPRKLNLVYAVLGNYAVNFALPRVGEIWRCTIISKKEKVPFSKLIGTLIVDRVFDMLMVLLITLIAFLLNAKAFHRNHELFDLSPVLTSAPLYIALGLVVVIAVAILVFFKENKIVKSIQNFFTGLYKDILVVGKMKQKKRFIVYTFGIWISYFLYFFITFFAFDFTAHLGFAAALFIFTLNSISMGVPSNGGLGPWQAATVLGLCAFMVSREHATAFATAVFAFQSIWVVLCGLFGIAMLSYQKSKESHVNVTD